MKPRHDEKKETPFCLAVGECRRPSRSAYSALYWCEREGRIQSAERAVPTHARSNITNLLSA